jgi:hypothetical protein
VTICMKLILNRSVYVCIFLCGIFSWSYPCNIDEYNAREFNLKEKTRIYYFLTSSGLGGGSGFKFSGL